MRNKTPSLVLVLALSCAAVVAATDRRTETIASGLEHLILSRGEVATEKSYRILLGVFDRQSDADRMLERAQRSGFRAFPLTGGRDYRIVTSSLPDRADAEEMRTRLIEQGLPSTIKIQEIAQDLSHPEGPWKIHVLVADPKRIELRVAHAYDAAIGLETTAELAVRRGALAAINGGYFHMKGLLAGDSRGVLRIDGRLLSEPDRGRAAVGFYEHGGIVRSVFGRLSFRGEIRLADGDRVPLDGINRKRSPSEIVLFTPDFHRTTLTPSTGAEIVIQNGRVSEVLQGAGSTVIPSAGMVLSIGNERVEGVLPRVRRGGTVSVETEIVPLLPDPGCEWEKAEDVVGGGPLLLWNGRRLEEPEKESISRVFFLARHPRTAVGVRADGTLLFVTVDGRQPEKSVGMTLAELTDLMLELGAVSAINLDGGGSTTMVIEGRVVNRPSGLSPRRNADAILLYPKHP